MNSVLLVACGVFWSLAVVTAAYSWMDMSLRVRSATYRRIAEADDRSGVRWRYVLLLAWMVAGTSSVLAVLAN